MEAGDTDIISTKNASILNISPDVLTVLNANTYLLEVNVLFTVSSKANLKERSEGFVNWFKSLDADEMPDIVVFEEILSGSAEQMMKSLCTDRWVQNDPMFKLIRCQAQGSPFGYATSVNNPTSSFSVQKSGGVVVLVKKGVQMWSAETEVFKQAAGADKWANKGFLAVKVEKAGQKYWVLATHTQAYEGQEKVDIRLSQFRQMRAYIDQVAAAGDRVLFVGDMNVFTHALMDKSGKVVNVDETNGMLEALGAPGVPARGGELVPRGFWRPLDEAITTSVDVDRNHYVAHIEEERALGNHVFDWVVTPGPGDALSSPDEMRLQYVPMKADSCFDSGLVRGKRTDDLSDHYAVFAQLCYGRACPPLEELRGHKGAANRLPSGPDCA